MFHIKYRPKMLKDVCGNKGAVNTLRKIDFFTTHAYCLSGPSGTGKTTLARIIATVLETHPIEIREINAANMRGIDSVRDMISDARYVPLQGRTKVFLIDEAHMLTTEAQNCLLKSVEEPPSHSYFIFCTTSPDRIIPTILNRCLRLYTQKLLDRDMITLLTEVMSKENFTVPEEILGLILNVADGVPRTALILLNSLKDVKDVDTALEMAYTEVYETAGVVDMCRALMGGKHWGEIVKIYNGMKDTDPEKIRISVFRYLGGCLKNSRNSEEQLFFTNLMSYFSSPLNYISASTDLLFHLSYALLSLKKGGAR